MFEIICQKSTQDSSIHCQLLLPFYLKDRCGLERIFFIVLKQLALSIKKTSRWVAFILIWKQAMHSALLSISK